MGSAQRPKSSRWLGKGVRGVPPLVAVPFVVRGSDRPPQAAVRDAKQPKAERASLSPSTPSLYPTAWGMELRHERMAVLPQLPLFSP